MSLSALQMQVLWYAVSAAMNLMLPLMPLALFDAGGHRGFHCLPGGRWHTRDLLSNQVCLEWTI